MASPAGGAPPHSLHLTALVQLVREIPEFLFGEVIPESESGSVAVSLDGERGSPEGKSDDVSSSWVPWACAAPARPWVESPGSQMPW